MGRPGGFLSPNSHKSHALLLALLEDIVWDHDVTSKDAERRSERDLASSCWRFTRARPNQDQEVAS